MPLVGPIILGSLIDTRERTLALESRAFGSRRDRTAYRIVRDPPIDRWLRLLVVLSLVVVLVAAFFGLLKW